MSSLQLNNEKESKPIQISELNNLLHKTINDIGKVKVEGEIGSISNYGKAMFLNLKDNYCNINAVIWNGGDDLKEGDKILIDGKLDYYKKGGKINFVIHNYEKIGLGRFFQNYEELKKKFKSKGYFDRLLEKPKTINNLGVLTSKNGAAVKDLLNILEEQNYEGNVVIKDCNVQGINCVHSLVKGFNELEKWKDKENNRLDAILITRGGGSFEDLIGFSDENLIETLHNRSIYLISAVGHEIDFMLTDFISDKRCSTPTSAGFFISEYSSGTSIDLQYLENSLSWIINDIYQHFEFFNNKLKDFDNQLTNLDKPLSNLLNIFNSEFKNIENNLHYDLDYYCKKLIDFENSVNQYDINKILNNNQIICCYESNKIINDWNKVKYGDIIEILHKDKTIKVKVIE
jgi:exodeoxyribonuclease VII large subunit